MKRSKQEIQAIQAVQAMVTPAPTPAPTPDTYIIDGTGRMELPVTPEITAVFGRICAKCPAPCCYRFTIGLPTKTTKRGTRVEIDWKAALAIHKGLPQEKTEAGNVRFAKRYFKPVAIRERGFMGRSDCTVTCTALHRRTHKCTMYAQRPRLCRIYMCKTGALKGCPPYPGDPHGQLDGYGAMAKGSKWLRIKRQAPVPGWRKHVWPLVRAYCEEHRLRAQARKLVGACSDAIPVSSKLVDAGSFCKPAVLGIAEKA